MRVVFTTITLEFAPVKLDPSQYLTNTEFQSEKPGLESSSEAIKKWPEQIVNVSKKEERKTTQAQFNNDKKLISKKPRTCVRRMKGRFWKPLSCSQRSLTGVTDCDHS
jgi:hypothetical protein